MLLIDRHLPHFHFSERHAITIRGRPERVHAAVATTEMADDPVVRALFKLRQWPARILSGAPERPAGLRFDHWTLLEQDGSQTVYALAGRFWRIEPTTAAPADAAAFAAFKEPGHARLVIGFRVETLSARRTLLSTETRIHCHDRAALLAMSCYWACIRFGSGLIRRRLLHAIKHRVESDSTA